MKTFWKITLGVVGVAVLAGGYAGYRTVWGKPFDLNTLLNRQAVFFLMDSPQLLTAIGLVDGTMLDFHSGKLDPFTLEERTKGYRVLRENIEEIEEFDRAELSSADQLTYDVALWFYGSQAETEKFDWLGADGSLYPVNQLFGIQNNLPGFMQYSHVVKNGLTARNYVARLEAMGRQIDEATADVGRQADLGVVPPDFVIEKVIDGIDRFLEPAPEDHALVTGFTEKMLAIEDLDDGERTELRDAAIAAVRGAVYPAWGRLKARFEALRPLATHEAGVWRLPEGEAFYATQLRRFTTTEMSADDIHAYGRAEVARIAAEMDAILRAQGLTDGTVAERMDRLRTDPRFTFENTDEGREIVLARYRELIAEVMELAQQYFSDLPTQPVEVERVPAYAEASSAGAYYNPPALDGSRPGRFFANLRDVNETPAWGMPTLAYHEAVPGHHFQIALAQSLEGLPFLRRMVPLSAYSEGWALYAEQLAKEMGLYDDDPYGDLGRLQAEIFRAVRLVVDTGMHAKRWSREQAIEYMLANTGMAEAEVVAEIERYIVMPGQACAYKIGMKRISDLRERAKAALGDRFDIRAFHAVVLHDGALPLELLERVVDDWIAESKGSTASIIVDRG